MGKIVYVRFERAIQIGYHEMVEFLSQGQEIDTDVVTLTLDNDGRFLRIDFTKPAAGTGRKRYQLIPLDRVMCINWEIIPNERK